MQATPTLSDYSDSDELEEFSEFSHQYQFFKLFRTCLHLTATNQYMRAHKIFYDSLSWFSTMFDETFVQRSHDIIQKYESSEYKNQYTYEQLEQLKYMRIASEFTRMLIDASSKNRVRINRDPTRRVELVPVGYGAIVNYEQMTTELFNKLAQVQKFHHPRETMKFFNHSLSWFGGIMDAQFVIQGYLIQETENSPEHRYRQLLIAFSKMLARKSIIASPYVTIAYKPTSGDVPHTVEDVVKGKKLINEEVKHEWEPDFTIIRSTF